MLHKPNLSLILSPGIKGPREKGPIAGGGN